MIRCALESLVFIAIGVWSIWDGFRLTAAARRVGVFDALGPDRYLMLVGGILVILGAAHLLTSQSEWQVAQGPEDSDTSWEGGSRFALLTLAFAAYAFVAPLGGYIVATALFFAAAYWIMDLRGWTGLPLAVALSTAAFAVTFITLADMPLPRGTLGLPF